MLPPQRFEAAKHHNFDRFVRRVKPVLCRGFLRVESPCSITTRTVGMVLLLLQNCAACAAQLAHTAPRCVRCHTRYCNSTCQHDHWRLGHKQICKKIHRSGGAEQCNADKSYKEAVAVAVEKCADDTKEQTCYICTEAVHWKTKECLVRMCACRGGSGFVHVSCLTEQAKILVEGAEEKNLATGTTRADCDAFNVSWGKWSHCGLCEQQYHGVVFCALGWACWKTYLSRPAWSNNKKKIF